MLSIVDMCDWLAERRSLLVRPGSESWCPAGNLCPSAEGTHTKDDPKACCANQETEHKTDKVLQSCTHIFIRSWGHVRMDSSGSLALVSTSPIMVGFRWWDRPR